MGNRIKEKELDILGLSKKDTEFLKNILMRSIDEDIKINEFAVEEGIEYNRNIDVVLISGKFLMEKAKQIYPRSKIISAKRIMTGQNLEKVMVLPKGKKVIVVNYPEEVTIETINSLKELGLDHLHYIPYWPGIKIDLNDIDTAISPGHVYLCPNYIKNKIDLGRRTISFSTFMEIIEALKLDKKNVDNFAKSHIQLMVSAGRKVSNLLNETKKLSKNLEVVLNNAKDSIIAIDRSDNISVFNPSSEKLFNIGYENAMGRNYKKVFKEYPELIRLFSKEQTSYDIILNLKDKKVVGTLTCLDENEHNARICTLNEVSAIQKLEQNVRRGLYKKGYIAKYSFNDITGSSKLIRKAINQAKKFAEKDLTVLIIGESGTGKELFAQAIHNASKRSKAPFIAVNFAALPENLVESELFGYEEGAFTGALKGGKAGLFEQAHKGTIFLDEIGDAPLKVQTRLLRVLQENEVMRIGASKVIPIDVRVIVATNKDLFELVKKGLFREDLYYRLKVLSLNIPPLRDRKEDILELIENMQIKENCNLKWSDDLQNIIKEYDWPGNVRELENVIKYICTMCNNSMVTIEDLPQELIRNKGKNSMMHNICPSYFDEDCLFLLKEIYIANKKGIRIGRKKLAQLCKKNNICLSESKIRTKLKHLEKNNLIKSGITKQGTFITQQGIKYLESMGLKQ